MSCRLLCLLVLVLLIPFCGDGQSRGVKVTVSSGDKNDDVTKTVCKPIGSGSIYDVQRALDTGTYAHIGPDERADFWPIDIEVDFIDGCGFTGTIVLVFYLAVKAYKERTSRKTKASWVPENCTCTNRKDTRKDIGIDKKTNSIDKKNTEPDISQKVEQEQEGSHLSRREKRNLRNKLKRNEKAKAKQQPMTDNTTSDIAKNEIENDVISEKTKCAVEKVEQDKAVTPKLGEEKDLIIVDLTKSKEEAELGKIENEREKEKNDIEKDEDESSEHSNCEIETVVQVPTEDKVVKEIYQIANTDKTADTDNNAKIKDEVQKSDQAMYEVKTVELLKVEEDKVEEEKDQIANTKAERNEYVQPNCSEFQVKAEEVMLENKSADIENNEIVKGEVKRSDQAKREVKTFEPLKAEESKVVLEKDQILNTKAETNEHVQFQVNAGQAMLENERTDTVNNEIVKDEVERSDQVMYEVKTVQPFKVEEDKVEVEKIQIVNTKADTNEDVQDDNECQVGLGHTQSYASLSKSQKRNFRKKRAALTRKNKAEEAILENKIANTENNKIVKDEVERSDQAMYEVKTVQPFQVEEDKFEMEKDQIVNTTAEPNKDVHHNGNEFKVGQEYTQCYSSLSKSQKRNFRKKRAAIAHRNKAEEAMLENKTADTDNNDKVKDEVEKSDEAKCEVKTVQPLKVEEHKIEVEKEQILNTTAETNEVVQQNDNEVGQVNTQCYSSLSKSQKRNFRKKRAAIAHKNKACEAIDKENGEIVKDVTSYQEKTERETLEEKGHKTNDDVEN